MKSILSFFVLVIILSLVLNACGPAPPAAITPEVSAATAPPPTLTPPPPTRTLPPFTRTPVAQGRTLVVISAADSGPGTLRQALSEARAGDTITFDATIFPPDRPVAIAIVSELPPLSQGHVTIDASDSGVILDGGHAGGEWTGGIVIDSQSNTIQGLQIIHFTGAGIVLLEHAAHNVIGGDPNTGSGPLGQGNLSSANADGMALFGALNNTIAGNLIGTDASGTNPQGNRVAGVFLQDGAQGNVIGPANVIAFNGDTGIDIRSADSTGNTITRNSIHGNQWEAIRLLPEAGLAPIAPAIFDFDLQAGTAAGAACPLCTVEVFSDDGHDGEIYEGSVSAGADGSFTLSTGVLFTGPGLTATATGADGSTSMFSPPTSGARQSALLQQGNTFPRTLFLSRSSQELQDTRIGDTYSGITVDNMPDPAQLGEHSAWLGHTWVRLTFGEGEWSAVESTGRYSPLSFGGFEDRVVNHLNELGVRILYNLIYFDQDLQAGPGFLRFRAEQEIQDYLDYARMVAMHFRGRVQYYETWNEPDIMNFGQQSIAVDDYINVIRRLVPVIHAADPQAKVVIGSGADLRDPQTQAYLMAILESDIMPLVDGIAIHPMYGSSPDYEELRGYYYEYPALIQRIKDTASTHGFAGEYFAEEMTWRTSFFTTDYEVWTYTQPVAAKYYARGIVINRGLGLYAGIGGECYDCYPEVVRVVQNLNTVLAGAEPTDSLAVQIEGEAADIRSYAFSLRDSGYLIALWTNGIAVDDDPGIRATLTFPGLPAGEVKGIDVLHGFEQHMLADDADGNLIIRDLLVKDYPIILYLVSVASH
jgi:hypothetical protein